MKNPPVWKFNAKTGTIQDDLRASTDYKNIVLYDVQADMGLKGRFHKSKMAFGFLMTDFLKPYTNTIIENLPQFTLAAADLAVPAAIGTNGIGTGRETIFIHLELSADKTEELRKFTHEQVNHQINLVVGGKSFAQPFINGEITNGRLEMTCRSTDEARTVSDLLNKK
jgi:hypothetical protein